MNKKIIRLLIGLLKRVLVIALIAVIVLLIKNALGRNESRVLNGFQLNLNNYIPSGMANSYKSEYFGIERLWIYKLNRKEIVEVSADLDNSYWEALSESDYQEFASIYDLGIIDRRSEKFDFQNTYYIFYDLQSDSYTDIQKLMADDSGDEFNLIIFIYDATNKYYYTEINLWWT